MRTPKDKKTKSFLEDMDFLEMENLKNISISTKLPKPRPRSWLGTFIKNERLERIYEYLTVFENEVNLRLDRILAKEQRLFRAKGNTKKVT